MLAVAREKLFQIIPLDRHTVTRELIAVTPLRQLWATLDLTDDDHGRRDDPRALLAPEVATARRRLTDLVRLGRPRPNADRLGSNTDMVGPFKACRDVFGMRFSFSGLSVSEGNTRSGSCDGGSD